jgi:hypothetical protein
MNATWARYTAMLMLLSTQLDLAAHPAAAQGGGGLAFEEVAVEAGIVRAGSTFGAAWGDVNGDRLPDLWVGNHGSGTGLLYEHMGDGRFSIGTWRIQQLIGVDAHGQAWADFDNDGDQDLIQVVGSGSAGNLLYVNEAGLLTERAGEFGVRASGARGRMPLWVDFDLDGRLDLILNHSAGGTFPPLVLRNTGATFEDVSGAVGFSVPSSALSVLGNLTGSTALEILVEAGGFLQFPGFVFETGSSGSFADVRSSLGILPSSAAAEADGVLADFTGDLRTDLFVPTRSSNMQLAQVATDELRARVNALANENAFTFDSSGIVTIEVFRNFAATPSVIRIGAAGVPATSFTVQLDPANPAVDGIADHVAGTDLGIFVGRIASPGTWWVSLSSPTSVGIDVRVRSAAPITAASPIGFPADPPGASPNLWVATGSGFEDRRVAAGLDVPMDCTSAVGGDFDNDMDVDLFVVCADPVVNTPDLLFENLGTGTFRQVPLAAGSAGPATGKGETVVSADYDEDGFLDLFVTNGLEGAPFNDGPFQLFRNQGNGNHWIELDLVAARSNRDAVGARVTVSAGGVTQLREQNGGMHRFSQNYPRLHFGLGPHEVVDRVDVTWPNGSVASYWGLSPDRVVVLTERASSGTPGCGLGVELIPLLLLLASCRNARRRWLPCTARGAAGRFRG